MGRFYARHVGSERSQIGDGAPRRADRGRDVDFDQSLRGLDELSRARFEHFLELAAEAIAHGEGGADAGLLGRNKRARHISGDRT